MVLVDDANKEKKMKVEEVKQEVKDEITMAIHDMSMSDNKCSAAMGRLYKEIHAPCLKWIEAEMNGCSTVKEASQIINACIKGHVVEVVSTVLGLAKTGCELDVLKKIDKTMHTEIENIIFALEKDGLEIGRTFRERMKKCEDYGKVNGSSSS